MENGLFVKPGKFEFHKTSVTFLSYVIQQGQLAADPAKLRPVTKWAVPEPKNNCNTSWDSQTFTVPNLGLQPDGGAPNDPHPQVDRGGTNSIQALGPGAPGPGQTVVEVDRGRSRPCPTV